MGGAIAPHIRAGIKPGPGVSTFLAHVGNQGLTRQLGLSVQVPWLARLRACESLPSSKVATSGPQILKGMSDAPAA